jgi:hypothetical protein
LCLLPCRGARSVGTGGSESIIGAGIGRGIA